METLRYLLPHHLISICTTTLHPKVASLMVLY